MTRERGGPCGARAAGRSRARPAGRGGGVPGGQRSGSRVRLPDHAGRSAAPGRGGRRHDQPPARRDETVHRQADRAAARHSPTRPSSPSRTSRLFTELEARNSELRVALEQQTATSELLKVIGRSTFDLQPVFETLAENAVRLCEAERAIIRRFDGQVLRVVGRSTTSSPEAQRIPRAKSDRARAAAARSARAALERRTVHIHDVHADPEYTFGVTRVRRVRTVLALPMLRADDLLGVIVIYRREVRPFTDGQIALLETFADQAAIAIENARLLSELQAKNADLTEALEQQTATARSCASSRSSPTDVQPVLDAVAESAARLCDAPDAAIFRLRRRAICMARRALRPDRAAPRRTVPVDPAGRSPDAPSLDGGPCTCARPRRPRPTEYPEARAAPAQIGHRTTLGVPLHARGRGHRRDPAPPHGGRALHRASRSRCSRPSPTRRSSPSRTCACSPSWRRATASCGSRSSSRRRPAKCSR